eukprot:scaffold22080_cov125-Isochrysis_galbana.AAC.6
MGQYPQKENTRRRLGRPNGRRRPPSRKAHPAGAVGWGTGALSAHLRELRGTPQLQVEAARGGTRGQGQGGHPTPPHPAAAAAVGGCAADPHHPPFHVRVQLQRVAVVGAAAARSLCPAPGARLQHLDQRGGQAQGQAHVGPGARARPGSRPGMLTTTRRAYRLELDFLPRLGRRGG